MRLTHLLHQKVIIARLVKESGGERMTFTTVTAEMGHIQPMTDSSSEISDGVFGKTFRLYMDGGVDIQEGDYLRDNYNNYYTVKADGVSRRRFGTFDYNIVIIEKTKSG